jgi:hypothetical protein
MLFNHFVIVVFFYLTPIPRIFTDFTSVVIGEIRVKTSSEYLYYTKIVLKFEEC